MFLFQSPSIFPLNRFIRLHGVNHNTPFPTALKPSFRLFRCFRIIASLPYLLFEVKGGLENWLHSEAVAVGRGVYAVFGVGGVEFTFGAIHHR